MLVIADDLSLTYLIHPTARTNVDTVIDTLLNHWLTHYPDSLMLHTDGGRHFHNRVVRGLTRLRGWERATVSTVYDIWAHGVEERMNKDVKEMSIPLCRHLKVEANH